MISYQGLVRTFLSERGVNFMQGYWISRPLPLDDFVRWLKKPYTPQW
ncbi:TPA: hypothetical protein QHM25_001913 [Escherichia coli]|nr:hypothetical protein [Escherichia coli]